MDERFNMVVEKRTDFESTKNSLVQLYSEKNVSS